MSVKNVSSPHGAETTASPNGGSSPDGTRAERPMPVAQQRLWMLEQMGAVGKAYHMTRWMHLRGELDRAALGRALDRLLARHESLRTTFGAVNGEPVQRAEPAEGCRFQLTEHDLRAHPRAEAERDRLMGAAADEPFDLERGPLIRGHLIRLPGDRHTLVFPAHHIVCDAWSVGVFDNDLAALYAAFSRGEPDPLPPLSIQFADYEAAQRSAMSGDELRRQADYWKEALAGAPPLLTVPADRPRPPEQDITAGYAAIELDEALTAALKALSQRNDTTMFTTLLAAWAVVLGRLAGQDDVVIGTPTANRKRRAVTRMIGFLVNTLALRVDLGGSPTVPELLARVKARALEAQRHQDIPFEQVVELLQPERTTEHTPVFQVLFSWQNAFRDPPGLPGLTLDEAGWTQHQTALFDLGLTLQEVDGRISGGIKYATALFDQGTVQRYAGYLHRVLEEMAADDGRPVSHLPLLPEDERRRMLAAGSDTGADTPRDLCLHELFQAQAARTPQAVAVEAEDGSLTYAELNASANRLAHHLHALGVRPDARVAVCAERGVELMVALLAVMKAGGAYVPLDPEYPADRLRYMLEDSAPVAMLAHGAPAELSAGAGVPRLELRTDAAEWAGLPDTDPPRDGLEPGHLAYTIYTSGSTGRPKGVMVEHRSVVNVLAWMHETFGPEPGGAVLQKTPVSFDASVRELFSPILAGARLVMARPGGHRDPGYLAETVRRTGVDTLHFVPAMLQAFAEHPDSAACTGVRRIVCGGQALPAALVREIHARLPQVALFNVYGPTEAAVDVTAWRCQPDPAHAVVPIGRAMANTRIYLLDAAGEPVPVGVAGELYIGGAQVARGYLGRPGLTAERFVPDPFSGEPGARLYRTGDVGKWGGEGAIHFAGRNDHQVKVRGFRIELGEIEARLAEHPGVRSAAVLAREDEPGDVRLAAYYVGAAGVDADALRTHLAALLPEHMVPAAFVALEALPLTPNGKVDRAALQAPDAAAYGERAYEPPAGPTETALAEIWTELLGVERIGRQDQFFELGGHSLLALKLNSRMRRRGMRVEAGVLFSKPTLAELAAAVDSGPAAPAKPAARGIPAGARQITPEMLPLVKLDAAQIEEIVAGVPGGAANVQDIYPLAPLQEGVLFHHLLAAEGDPYLLPILFSVDTRERVDAFVAALRAIIARHDVLRTAVVWEGLPEPVQVVWRDAPLVVEEVETDEESVPEQLLRRFGPGGYRMDVRQAPLMRVQVARDAASERWVVLLLRHHLVTDHTTAEVLLAELQAHLSGQRQALLPPVPFRDFVARARQGLSRAQHESFFAAMLGDVTEPTMPFGMGLAPEAGQVAEARLELDAELSARLRDESRRLGVSAASVCHLAWAQVMATVSGRGDVVFGTVLFGRMSGGEGAERAMGPFMNTLPLRIRVDGVGAEAGVRQTHEAIAALLRHEHASLALAQRCSGVRAPTPLFSALLNYRHGTAERDARSTGALDGIQVIHAEGWTHFPLTMSVDDLGDGFWLTAAAAAPVEPERVCALMRTALEGLLEALQTAPDTALASVAVLPAAERRQVVEEWNQTGAPFPADAAVHALFEAQAARTPDAVAVLDGEARLTYAELNAAANRLAHALVDAGVAPGDRVAVLVPRSVELVVSELAVLKAGAAYVPIDPSFPAERIAFMVADSGSRVVLAQPGAEIPVAVSRIDIDRLAEGRTDAPAVAVPGGAPAYVMYTSGSTGVPKGVVVPHRAIARLAINNGYAAFGPGERVAFATNPAFDATTMEVWGPLLNGGQIVVIAQEVLLDPRRFGDALARFGVTVLWMTAGLFNQYAEELREVLPRLGTLIVGGDVLDPAVIARVLKRGGPRRLVNGYGPTESTTFAITHEITGVPRGARGIPLGRPISNTRVYVLDARGEPVPVGVTGELYVGGAGVALGYLGRSGLTAERFVPDVFGGEAGARLYRTGDLGRWLPDGTIEFAGRADFQVKVRGHRVELGEIEARLSAFPGVEGAVVVARDDAGDRRLVAYYLGTGEAEALRAHLLEGLPEYMVPAAYVRLDAFPLTANGKVDRRALPAPEGGAHAVRAYEPPLGSVEEEVARIWSEVMRAGKVGRWDSFFDLGGHSLVAVQVISRVRQSLKAGVSIGELFATPVLADFARLLETPAATALPVLLPAAGEERAALSFAQRRMWFLEQLGAGGTAYHIAEALRLRGALDGPALRRALDHLVVRHEALRTTFGRVGEQPVQRVAPEGGFALAEHDLAGHPHPEAELRRLLAEEAGAPFDLERGPLIRGRLVRLGEDDHMLAVTMHHIVSDGWSVGVLVRELGALYAAFRRGEPDPLPPLPVQYADYAAWQRRGVDGEVLREQVDYWTAALAGAPELLEIPADRPRPARQDHAGAAVPVELGAELTAGLRALAQRQGTTLFMTLLAGWAAVLGRLSGQDEVVVGSPTANRTVPEVEGLVGLFVNTLALRVDLSGSPTVAELLGRVRARVLEAQQNQDIPFEQVVERVQPVRSMAHTPLFQVMFAWQNAPGGSLELPGVEVSSAGAASRGTAKFDLSLSLAEADGGVAGALEYATALFDRETVERYLGYLRRALQAMAAEESAAVDRLPLLGDEERGHVVREWNATDAPFPGDRGVHELFEEQVRRAPGAVAVMHGDASLTYAELDARANRLAHALVDAGVAPGARVAVLVPRSAELVVCELAVLKTGAAYVPIDPSFPAERIAFMVADSGSRIVLSLAGAELPDLPATERIDADTLAEGRSDPVRVALGGDAAAYVMYTSGSTGLPKGVVVPHRAISRLVINGGYAPFGPGNRVAFAANPAFDATTMEVWGPLLNGGQIVVIAQEVLLDPRRFGDALARFGVTVLWMTAGLFNQYADELREVLPRLGTLIVGGDVLDPGVIARVLERGGPRRLVNGYGPTESTTFAITHEITGVARGARGIPLGRPISNTRVYVLDGRGEPVPVGVTGELYVGGAGVAHGYLGRPGLTAERFVPDAFGGEAGARLYRTGDLGRWLPDGTIEFVGRSDFQVKVRGHRIEPGEIEARLLEHPSVRESLVMARTDASGDSRLAAYFVGEDVEAGTLRSHLAATLPEYMVPAAFVRLEAMPLTPNGKVDRRALPAPEGEAFAARVYEAPLGETETGLAGIWAELLGVERVGRHDHFFELGGHSLLAVQVISRVRQALGVEVALGDLFVRPVLADFAAGLDTAARAAVPDIEPVDRGGPLALSFAQQRLWFLEQLDSVGVAYHIPASLRLEGELDRDALGRALDGIVARHEALRTTFVQVDGHPAQRIAPEGRFHLVDHDLVGQSEPEAELGRVMAEEAGAPFDLERGPLIRGRLIRLAADDHVLAVTMHHIVSDGWSMGVLTHELSALYGAFLRGEADPLPPLPVQYADYAAWLRRWVEGEVLQRQTEYWTRTLSGAPELLELPADHARPARQDHAGAAIGVELDAELTAGLKALSQRHGTTLYMTLLAGWAAVLGRLSGQDDVVVGSPTANRGRAEIEGLIGFFVNTLALRVDVSGAPTVAELLGRVKERALAAQAHQDIPFEQVVERVQPARSLAHTPLFQVMLAWQNAPGGSLELPGLRVGSAGSASRVTAKFDLTLSLAEADGRVVGGLEYATALFERETVERWLGYLRRVLRAMVADDAAALERLPLLDAAERRQVLETWNDTAADHPRELAVHQLFEAQAARAPHALAVACGGEELSYAELNERANRLAHHLRALGVGPDARVAICMERGVEMIVGVLAVLKAGGAYVPLDPAYPGERLRYMLEDSAPAVLLAQAPLAARFADAGVPVIGPAPEEWADGPADNPDGTGVRPEHLAYLIYTSGSTGTPKGVMVPHRGLTHYAAWARSRYVPGEPLAFPLYSSFTFDLTVTSIFVPLISGGTIVVYADEQGGETPIRRVFAEDRVDVVKLTPSHLALLEPGDLATRRIRTLIVGGEELRTELARSAAEAAGGETVVYNEYGPTEMSVGCTIHRYDAKTDRAAALSIGGPVSNIRAYVLDGSGEPVPTGVAGELYVGGDGEARGYLNQPARTAERFVPDAFSGRPGARLYRTGDLARWLPGGRLEFLGRGDFQVKVRGHRIELGEIEARLAEHPAVRETAVMARDDAAGDRRLVAYYVADEALDAQVLRAHLSERLPEYMVPAAYVALEVLPLTPNGKIDRRALPAPGGGAYASRGYEAPAGETETALAEIWSSVLRVERVGRHDHFFELGGHSLLAVQVGSRVRQLLGVEVGLSEIFTRPVLADFARAVSTAARSELPPVTRADRDGPLALSFAQQRLWFLEQLGSGGPTYHMPARLRLRGALDRGALIRALDRIVQRHEVLRTTFVPLDGEPVQRIAPPDESRFDLREHDLAGDPEALAELRRLSALEMSAPFDLEHGPLIRGRLVRVADDEHVLLVTMHHIVSDGWSMGVLTRELSALYGAFSRGDADPLRPLPVQYADYAAWQRRWVDGEVLRRQADYWTRTLAGAPELLDLPTDHARAPVQDHAGGTVALELDEALTAALKALGQRHGATLFMTLLAGWAVVLGRLSGQDDVVVGTPTANRGQREAEGLIGFFVNALALRVDLAGAPTLAGVLGRVKARTLEAQQHQDIPFEQVVERVQPVRRMSHSPLFQVMFAWQNTPDETLELPGMSVAPAGLATPAPAKFDLSLSLAEADGRIAGNVTYATALFERSTAERYTGYLRRVLEAMVADEGQSVDRVPLLDAAERRRVVEEWNATEAEYPSDACIHELFEAQAARAGNAVAVVAHDGSSLSYGGLNARANQLAHHLRHMGAGPGTRVAICMERSPEMVVGLLAILKAGAAYVPLDPAYPAERLRYMLDDSAPAAQLVHGAAPEALAGSGTPVLDLAAASPPWSGRPRTDPGREGVGLTAADAAYVIYTSGSTGQPKGVVNEHGCVVSQLAWARATWGLGAHEAVLHRMPISFDVSVRELFLPLAVGARVVLARPDAGNDPAHLVEIIRREGIGTLHTVPSLLQIFIDHPGAEECTTLRRATCGGEVLAPALVRRFRERLPNAELYHMYGPTETTVAVISRRCLAEEPGPRIPLGRPVANTRVYVLDPRGEPVPAGVGGEIHVAGAQVARGYLNRPELTAERFVADPFSARPGARMYRTGDLGRWRADGTLEYLGRNDFQVKVRGFRIELGEIEARLAQHPGVRGAAVLAREDTAGDQRLVAYYESAEEVGAEALIARLAAELPGHMVPAAYVRMETLPLTPNGKVDREALPAPTAAAYGARGYEAPVGETEELLAELWRELLGVERIGRHDHFFRLGGHSLLVTRLVLRIKQTTEVDLPLREVFEAPVLSALAERLVEAQLARFDPDELAELMAGRSES